METKVGLLGKGQLAADTLTSIYQVTDAMDAKDVVVFIANFADAVDKVKVSVAVIDGEVGDVAAEDYIIKEYTMKFGNWLKLEDLTLSPGETLAVISDTAGVVVRVMGVEQDTANIFGVRKLTSQAITYSAFTDNGDATGYIDFTTGQLPAGAIVLGWRAVVTAGFTGDTTAVMQVGVSGDLDAFSAVTTGSVLAAGTIGSAALAAAAATPISAAKTPRVTVTGGADFGSIAAGAMTVEIFYMNTNASNNDTNDRVNIKSITSQNLLVGNFTDSGGTSGYIDFTSKALPAGAIVLGWKGVVTGAFSGDTSAVVQVGVSGDTDAFSADTAQSCFAAGTIGSFALAAAAATPIAALKTPRVTITGASDFTAIVTAGTGAMTVTIFYVEAE